MNEDYQFRCIHCTALNQFEHYIDLRMHLWNIHDIKAVPLNRLQYYFRTELVEMMNNVIRIIDEQTD